MNRNNTISFRRHHLYRKIGTYSCYELCSPFFAVIITARISVQGYVESGYCGIFSSSRRKECDDGQGGAICLNLPEPFDNAQFYKELRIMSLNRQTKDASYPLRPDSIRCQMLFFYLCQIFRMYQISHGMKFFVKCMKSSKSLRLSAGNIPPDQHNRTRSSSRSARGRSKETPGRLSEISDNEKPSCVRFELWKSDR